MAAALSDHPVSSPVLVAALAIGFGERADLLDARGRSPSRAPASLGSINPKWIAVRNA
jgi:hypothetical protein